MTVIVGVTTPRHSFIASDTLAFENSHRCKAQEKIIKKGKLLVGACGSYAVINCIQHHFNPPKKHKNYSDTDYLFKQIYISLRNALVKFDLITSSEGKQTIDGSILIVYEGKIYVIQEDFSMLEIKDTLYIIGSGSEYTFGAYKALDIHKDSFVVPDRIRESIRIAAQFCPSINADVSILSYRHEDYRNSTNNNLTKETYD